MAGTDEGFRLLVPTTGVFAAYMAFVYSYQFLLNLRRGWKFSLYIKLFGPIASICMNCFKRETPGPDVYGFIMMIHYHGIFMAQGIIDQVNAAALLKHRKAVARSSFMPFGFVIAIVVYALTSPMVADTGFIFYYPLYNDYMMQCLFTTGSWFWIYILYWIGETVMNK